MEKSTLKINKDHVASILLLAFLSLYVATKAIQYRTENTIIRLEDRLFSTTSEMRDYVKQER